MHKRLLALVLLVGCASTPRNDERALQPAAVPLFRALPQRDAFYLRITSEGVATLRAQGLKSALFGGARTVDDNSLTADAFLSLLMDAVQGVPSTPPSGGVAPGLVDTRQPTWVSFTTDALDALRTRRYGLPSTDADLPRGLLLTALLPARNTAQLEQALRAAWASQVGPVPHAAVRFTELVGAVRWELYLEDRPQLHRNAEADFADFLRQHTAQSDPPLRATPALAAFLASTEPLATYFPTNAARSLFAATESKGSLHPVGGELQRFRGALEKSQLFWLLEPQSAEVEDLALFAAGSSQSDFTVRTLATWTERGARRAAQTGPEQLLPSFPPPDADTVLDFDGSLGDSGFRPPPPRALAVYPGDQRDAVLKRLRNADELASVLLWLISPLSAAGAWSETGGINHPPVSEGGVRLRVWRADPDALDKSLPRGLVVLHVANRAVAEKLRSEVHGKLGIGGALVRARITPDKQGQGALVAFSFNTELGAWLDHAPQASVAPGVRATLGPAAGELLHKYLGAHAGQWIDRATHGPTGFVLRPGATAVELELNLGRPPDRHPFPAVSGFVPAGATNSALDDCRFELHERVRLALAPLVSGERAPEAAAVASLDNVLNLEPACVRTSPELHADMEFLRARLSAAKLTLAALPPPGPPRSVVTAPSAKARDSKRSCISVQSNQPRHGKADALVTLILVEDFQCPFCARATRSLHEAGIFTDPEVRLVWMNYPLPFHARAPAAAEAALAANAQGKFWEMHDLLYATPPRLDAPDLDDDAKTLRLDLQRFDRDLETHRFRAQVEAEKAAAAALDVSGTPTFFFNGRRVVGARPTDELRSVLEEEKARARAMLERGVSRKQLAAVACEDEHVTL